MVEYEFLDPQGLRSISAAEAISHARAACVFALGYDLYRSDQQALADFVAINHAQEVGLEPSDD